MQKVIWKKSLEISYLKQIILNIACKIKVVVKYMYLHISGYKLSTTHRVLKSRRIKMGVIYVYVIKKMCPPGYHHRGTHALCVNRTSCAQELPQRHYCITWRTHHYIYIYIYKAAIAVESWLEWKIWTMTTEFCSDALTDWAIKPRVQLTLKANFVQLL